MGENAYKIRTAIYTFIAKMVVNVERHYRIAKTKIIWFFGEVKNGVQALYNGCKRYKPKHMKKTRILPYKGDRYHEQIGFNSIYKDAVR